MPINNKLARHQQQMIQHYARKNDAYSFFKRVASPELLSTAESLIPEHRERQFPPTETLSMFLAQALNQDRSCEKAVNDSAVKRLIGGLPLISTATGSYCRARQRLPVTMVSALACQTGRLIQQETPDPWHWQGKHVYVIDGTTLTMPDTLANQAAYPYDRRLC
ncbi:transposase [Gammaproteobacteria bacterium 53_120_T64]|nr:transposase [Gammaproteobacteria bacterium 53_120_T64]